MGACTVTVTEHYVQGNKRVVRGTVALSSSVASGGDTFTGANFGLDVVDYLSVGMAGGYLLRADLTNSKIVAYKQDGSTGALVDANGADLSSLPANFRAEGV